MPRDEAAHRDSLGVAHLHGAREHSRTIEQNFEILRDAIDSHTFRHGIERVLQALSLRLFFRIHDAARDAIKQPASLRIREKELDRRLPFLQRHPHTRERAPGTARAHKGVEFGADFRKYFHSRAVGVRAKVR